MLIHDRIYGQFSVNEPVLLELLTSPSLIRLKKITQSGMPAQYSHLRAYTRYEHSVGVFLLLRKLGASLEEQIAGLIHDVSHLAFSHIADWALNAHYQKDEGLQDSLMDAFINNSELITILKRHNYVVERILNKENFTLLERPIPDMCADRLDYALREFIYYASMPQITTVSLDGISVHNGEIVFSNPIAAKTFGIGFINLQLKYFAAFETVARYYLLSKVLRLSLERQYLLYDDLLIDEVSVLKKVEAVDDFEIQSILNTLRLQPLPKEGWKDGVTVVKKFRYVDPKIMINGKPIRLTSLDRGYKRRLERSREINRRGFLV